MIIRVKMIDENGQPKGKAYTYKSDIDVSEGDLVTADFGGAEKVLTVVEIGIDPTEIEGLPYEIKTISGIADEIPAESTIDIEIEEEKLPVIRFNFDAVKTALTETLEKYKGIVVTEATLPGCKSTQKELAGIRIKLDTYRKDKKKELSKPIEAFENQCKELISLIEQAEKPIKDGIQVFDDQKREEKKKTAEKLIKTVIEEIGLNEKYGAQMTVIDKYRNLTATEKDVKDDLEARALALLSEQNREQELIEIIRDSIDTENQRINEKLKFEDFQRLLDRNVPTKDILAEVKAAADRIYRAEHPEPKPEPTVIVTECQPPRGPIIEPQAEQMPEETIHYAVYRITGSAQALMSVSQFLKENGITYNVTEQGEI